VSAAPSNTYRVATVTVDAQGISPARSKTDREKFIFDLLHTALANRIAFRALESLATRQVLAVT
jgi:hypothetical protein